jgi:hypothetical protein
MSDQSEEVWTETDEWPVPSADVDRQLDQPAVAWPEPGGAADATPRPGSA